MTGQPGKYGCPCYRRACAMPGPGTIVDVMPNSASSSLRTLRHESSSLSKDGMKALQAVRGLVAALSQSARLVEQRTGVSNAQLFLLGQIAARPDQSVNELAERAMTHQSTASVVLSRLERRGLVRRVRSPADGRSVVLRLTPAGRRLLRRAPAPATSRVVEAIQRLTESEVRKLREGVCALGREAGFKCEAPPMLFQEEADPGKKHGPSAPARRSPRKSKLADRSRSTSRRATG
jgi:DNA-binding MarR family transcriptional regulator